MPKKKRRPGEGARLALTRWLERSKAPSVASFATSIGCAPVTVYAILDGSRRPSIDLAAAIERRTSIRAARWGG